MEVEILGFAIAEIQEYVEKFCKDDDGTRMWNLIQESEPEYLNSNKFLPEEVLCTLDELKRLAKNGMDKGELIFEFETKDLIAK